MDSLRDVLEAQNLADFAGAISEEGFETVADLSELNDEEVIMTHGSSDGWWTDLHPRTGYCPWERCRNEDWPSDASAALVERRAGRSTRRDDAVT